MTTKDSLPPTGFIERTRSLLRAMHSNDINMLPDGTTTNQLETLIQQSIDTVNEVGNIGNALKNKQGERDNVNRVIWKVTKGGIAFIVSRFGDDALQMEQVGRKRRSRYARPKRKSVPQTAAAEASSRKPKSRRSLLNENLPASIPISYTNGTHEQ